MYGVTLTIEDAAIQKSVKRFGINLGSINYYDSGQMMKNLLFRNPGFEGEINQSLIRCGAATETTCTDEDQWSVWPADYWKNASYEFIWGAAKGRKGRVIASTSSSKSAGVVLMFDQADTMPKTGDYLIVGAVRPGHPQAGWWPSVSGSATIMAESNDLSPHTNGKQAVVLSASKESRAVLRSFFDTTEGRTFIQLNGAYALCFRAKGKGGNNRICVSVTRKTSPQRVYLNRELTLAPTWTDQELSFTTNERGEAIGPVEVSFAASNATVLLDDVSLVNTSDKNPTAFRQPVVAALRELHPGLLRYWGGQLGDTLDNQLAPASARQRSGYSAFSSEAADIQIGLNEFLQLCAAVNAEPYYVVPITLSFSEMKSLIEFLAGSVQSSYGKLRQKLGRSEPWTTQFLTIHLQFGNEPWNSIFKGGNMEWTKPYAERANELFRVARSSPYYAATKFDLVVSGQAVYVERNKELAENSRFHDTLAIGPYLAAKLSPNAGSNHLFAPLFAEAHQINSREGYIGRNTVVLPQTRFSIYETNIDPREGTASQQQLDDFAPSLGVGLGVIHNMLLMLREHGIKDQMLWSLSQYMLTRADQKRIKVYGAVVDMGVTNRRRPSFLALQLANTALNGDMLQVRQNDSASLPVEAFAFATGKNRSLILLNLHNEAALPIAFAGRNAPQGETEISTLQADKITANNENECDVQIKKRTINNQFKLTLPPFSMTVLRWQQ